MQAWIPFFINEFNYAFSEIREHLSIQNPNANNYLNLIDKFILKFNYILIFRLIFFQNELFTNMLNHISSTETTLEQNLTKTRKRIVANLSYIPIAFLFFTRIMLFIVFFVSDFIPNEQNADFSQTFYEVFVKRFRTRFGMDISPYSTYTTWDYIFGIYEVEVKKISEIIWISCDTLITGLVPLTFTIIVNRFLEVHKIIFENDTSVLTACCLFNNLENMSNYINSNWGIICLIRVIDVSTRCAFNFKIWIKSRDHNILMVEGIRAVSLFLMLYL